MHFSAEQSVFLGVALLALPSATAPIPAAIESVPSAGRIGTIRRPNDIQMSGRGVVHPDGGSHQTSRTAAQITQEQSKQEGPNYVHFSHYKPLSGSNNVPEIYPGAVTANSKVARHHTKGSKGATKSGASASEPVAPAEGIESKPATTVPGFPSGLRPKIVEGTVRMPSRQPEPMQQLGTRSPEEEKPPTKSDKIVGGLNKVNDAGNAVAGIVQTGESLWDAGKAAYDHFKNKGDSKEQSSNENQYE